MLSSLISRKRRETRSRFRSQAPRFMQRCAPPARSAARFRQIDRLRLRKISGCTRARAEQREAEMRRDERLWCIVTHVEVERHGRPVEGGRVARFFNTYWQLRRRSGPCGCASCAPSTPRRQGRACGILDSWLRSGRRSGRRVAGTQHAVATPFLGGRKKKYRKQAHAAHR